MKWTLLTFFLSTATGLRQDPKHTYDIYIYICKWWLWWSTQMILASVCRSNQNGHDHFCQEYAIVDKPQSHIPDMTFSAVVSGWGFGTRHGYSLSVSQSYKCQSIDFFRVKVPSANFGLLTAFASPLEMQDVALRSGWWDFPAFLWWPCWGAPWRWGAITFSTGIWKTSRQRLWRTICPRWRGKFDDLFDLRVKLFEARQLGSFTTVEFVQISNWGRSLKTGLRNLQGTVDITRPRDAWHMSYGLTGVLYF